jgi:drug/metabolite transporter (DMT)-like permease
VLLGWWLLAEPISARTLLAAAVIVAGVALTVMPRGQNRARLPLLPASSSAR